MHQKDNIKFQNLTIKDGLSQTVTEAIIQDSKGFMWFCTQDGLNQYDGKKFTIYRNDPENPDSICYNYLRCLCEDKNKNLWIGSEKGLSRFDREKDIFINYKFDPADENSIPNDQIRSVYEDKEGTLWIGTYMGGLAKYNQEEDNFSCFKFNAEDPSSLSDNRVNFIAEDCHSNLWIGTWGGGVNLFNREECTFKRYKLSDDECHRISFNRVNSICPDKNGNIYVGTNYGLFFLEKGKEKFRHFLKDPSGSNSISDNLVSTIFIDSLETVFIGTRENGINIFNPVTEEFSIIKKDKDNPDGINNNSITTFYEDRSGIIWIGTYGGGLNKFNRQSNKIAHYYSEPNNPNSLSSNLIFNICEDSDGILWIGTRDEGFNRFDRKKNEFTVFKSDVNDPSGLTNNTINFIFDYCNDFLFICTNEGLNKFNKRTKKFTRYLNVPGKSNSIGHNVIFTMVKDSKGIMWISTMGGGISKFDPEKDEFTVFKHDPADVNSINTNRVKCICIENDNIIWIGTDDAGLIRYDVNEGKFFTYKNDPDNFASISSNSIMTIYQDKTGNLWLGTVGGGLNKFDKENKTFRRYYRKDGLPNDTIIGILEDAHGNLWLSTNFGLSKFDPVEETFRNYDQRDGFQSNEFNQMSYLKLKSGELAFGGVNGFNIFHPDDLKDNTCIPPVVITNFLIANKSVPVSEKNSVLKKAITFEDEITLSHRDNVFSFEFASLDYSIPGKNQYAYKMEGFDKEWVYPGNRGFATYTNLNHGEYIFRVRGSNNDGVWNEEGSSLKIKITPPFWRTLWFKGLGALAVAGTAGSIYKGKLDKVRKEKKAQEEFTRRLIDVQESDRKRISMELHDSIGQDLLITKNKIMLSLSKPEDKEFIINNIKEASDIISETLNDVREISYTLHPYQIERLGLSRAIQSIVERASKSTNIVFTKSIDKIDKLVKPEVEINLYRIIQECINNILKHSKATEVILNVSKGSDNISILISDDGVGFDQNKVRSDPAGHGFGLRGIAERVKLFDGRFNIQTAPGEGTDYNITVPFKDY